MYSIILMLKKLEIFGFLLCVFIAFNLNGQSSADSIRQLKTVTVTQSRLSDYVIAPYELSIDSTMLSLASNGSLTDLLRKQGLGHIRTYGPGGLASPSFRGTGSSHTSILWNGINLVSPLSGQLDLSLVPAGLFDDATIQTGGATSLSGNGTIGANIHLNNNVTFNQGLKASAAVHAGAFGSQYYDGSFRLSGKKFETSTKLFLNSADNDFKFKDKSKINGKIIRRKHSAFDQHGLLQQFSQRVSDKSIVSFRVWYQKSMYEVPEIASSQDDAEATEENTFYRVLGGWNYGAEKFEFNYQTAFIRQDLDYEDPKTGIFSLNRYNNIIQNAEANFLLATRSRITTGLQYSWEEGVVDDFGSTHPIRNRIALFSAYKFQPFEKWEFALSAREEFVNGKTTPLAPALSATFAPSEAVKLFTNLSRNYRLPTFNDLYWLGGGARGNPSLRSELSMSAETGISIQKSWLTFKAVAFSNHVDNWILWSPDASQVWTPQNIKKVWARGLEMQTSIDQKIGSVRITVSGLYSYTRSTNESIYDNGNPNEKGKQLMLTPVHQASGTLHLGYQKYWLRVVHSFTGDQFTDTDNTVYNVLPFYNVTNVFAWKDFQLNTRWRPSLSFEVNNLLDTKYEARPGYPMPLRNYKISLRINFNKPNKHD